MTAKERRAEAARKKKDEARRRAAIAEQRRREEAARIARERRLAFERGLKNQTAENILKDNLEGEDLAVRRAAIDALGNRAGTVVVMEAKTGKIVSIVNQEWAIKNSFKPCSTIKLVTGVAGLNERVINEEGGIGESTKGWDLDMALARSANPYFQKTGVNFGNEKMNKYAKELGLGERTGINAEGETPGKLPFNNRNPRIYSHGDDFEVTPLQLAVMVTAIANDGKKVVPQIVKPNSPQKASFRPKFKDTVDVPYKTMQGVIPGMIGAAEYGTARRGVEQGMGIAGKTGSCIFKGTWIGLFASVAPVEDPQYSVVVITRGESERGKYAAAVAGNIYRALASKLRRNNEKYVALKNLRPTPPPSDLATIGDDEEEEDEVTAELETVEERPVIVVGTSQADAPKKLIQRTTQSRPTNSPQPMTPAVKKPAAGPVNLPAKKMSFDPVVIKFDKEKAARSGKTTVTKTVSKPITVAAKRSAVKTPAKAAVKTAKKTVSKATAKPVKKAASKVSAKTAAKKPTPKTAARSSKPAPKKAASKTAAKAPAKAPAKASSTAKKGAAEKNAKNTVGKKAPASRARIVKN